MRDNNLKKERERRKKNANAGKRAGTDRTRGFPRKAKKINGRWRVANPPILARNLFAGGVRMQNHCSERFAE